jgi:hypothetical protein
MQEIKENQPTNYKPASCGDLLIRFGCEVNVSLICVTVPDAGAYTSDAAFTLSTAAASSATQQNQVKQTITTYPFE